MHLSPFNSNDWRKGRAHRQREICSNCDRRKGNVCKLIWKERKRKKCVVTGLKYHLNFDSLLCLLFQKYRDANPAHDVIMWKRCKFPRRKRGRQEDRERAGGQWQKKCLICCEHRYNISFNIFHRPFCAEQSESRVRRKVKRFSDASHDRNVMYCVTNDCCDANYYYFTYAHWNLGRSTKDTLYRRSCGSGALAARGKAQRKLKKLLWKCSFSTIMAAYVSSWYF